MQLGSLSTHLTNKCKSNKDIILCENDNIIKDPNEVANILNEYFTAISYSSKIIIENINQYAPYYITPSERIACCFYSVRLVNQNAVSIELHC